ncbi:MAG: hypothetical protein KA154_06485 [Gemmatimonadaceae bacterium]|nr:hypothetical protein [Gemmatimonadaceae bacterium]MCC6430802.1 hypothetical protein [Gemmatimonadaceae bacterium]
MLRRHDAVREAVRDPSLRAEVVARVPLHYTDGADESLDRPAHVRAGSSLAWLDDHLALVQDDANFIALVHPRDGHVQAIALPPGEGGVRQFDDGRGNKKHKLDLEACVTVRGPTGSRLMAFGSGSKRRRRRIAILDDATTHTPRVRLHDAEALYELLEATTGFAGSDMNIEGAMVVADVVRLFGRGNGAPRRGLLPLNATCDLSLSTLMEYLEHPGRHSPPVPQHVTQYQLGHLRGTPLGFTDCAHLGAAVLYSAAAEASKDAVDDGVVTGSVIGVIDARQQARYAELTDETGQSLLDKVEGLVLARDVPNTAYVVIDRDDATSASELCTVALRGEWFTSTR